MIKLLCTYSSTRLLFIIMDILECRLPRYRTNSYKVQLVHTGVCNVTHICDWICEKGSSTHIQFYELGRP